MPQTSRKGTEQLKQLLRRILHATSWDDLLSDDNPAG